MMAPPRVTCESSLSLPRSRPVRTCGTGGGARQIGVSSACGRPEFGETEIEQLRAARVSMMLAGFRSRWMIPCRCAWSRALAISFACVSAWSSSSGPWPNRAASVSPSRYSMTR